MSLTRAQRQSLPDSDFAVPGKRALPIPDARHVRMAWSQVGRTDGLTDAERTEAKARIKAKAKALGVDTSSWDMEAADAGSYIRRNLTPESAAALTEWAMSQGFINITPAAEMHVTVVNSRRAVALPLHLDPVTISGGDRDVIPVGDKGAIVLRFQSDALQARFAEARAAGALWGYDDYMPHVTITYSGEPTEVEDASPFTGDITLGPEIHEPINDDWAEEKGMRLEASSFRLDGEGLEAMALSVPHVPNHPNRMPFTGILTRLNKPSDGAPGGSGGKRVILTKSAAERALPSLLGMAVDFTPDFDGHDATRKIGVITAANIEGDAIHVGGFIYARDFPKEASRIQTDKALLGFSWELADIYVERLEADPLVITDACFTGAAILRKDKAAYTSTSLAAAAEDPDMTKEEIAAAMGETVTAAMKPLADAMAALAAASAKQAEQLTALQAAAADAEAAKAEATAKAEAEAKDGEIQAMKTKIADLEAAAAKAAPSPERKTLSPQITALLARADLTLPNGDDKLSVGSVDAALSKAGLPPVKRMEIKNELHRAGALG